MSKGSKKKELKQCNKARSDTAKADAATRALAANTALCQQQLAAAQQQLASRQADCSLLQQQLDELRQSHGTHDADQRKQHAERETDSEQINQLRQQLSSLQQASDRERDEREHSDRELHQRLDELSALQRELKLTSKRLAYREQQHRQHASKGELASADEAKMLQLIRESGVCLSTFKQRVAADGMLQRRRAGRKPADPASVVADGDSGPANDSSDSSDSADDVAYGDTDDERDQSPKPRDTRRFSGRGIQRRQRRRYA